MINLEVPKKFRALVNQAHQSAAEVLRPHSRTYDRAEHTYPKEMDLLASMISGLDASTGTGGAGAAGVRRSEDEQHTAENRNGGNLSTVLSVMEMCWGDVGLLLAMPDQGLGNSAIASVADEDQMARFGNLWASMAITEPECGSDSAAIRTTARLEGEEYVLNGEKIYVTAGERSEAVVVWATLDPQQGRAAIKSFVVEKSRPGIEVARVEKKLGIKASDTAAIRLQECRIPKENLLGSPEIDTERGFAGVMQTFDNTRPVVAAMAVGVARASLEETRSLLAEAGVEPDYDRPRDSQPAAAAEYLDMEADWEAAYLLVLQAAWMADNAKPNSLQASMAKAKAGRTANAITLRCVQLCGTLGYSEHTLLEKWSRDSKILDIFEGTQQIQQLIVARRLLGKSSSELK